MKSQNRRYSRGGTSDRRCDQLALSTRIITTFAESPPGFVQTNEPIQYLSVATSLRTESVGFKGKDLQEQRGRTFAMPRWSQMDKRGVLGTSRSVGPHPATQNPRQVPATLGTKKCPVGVSRTRRISLWGAVFDAYCRGVTGGCRLPPEIRPRRCARTRSMRRPSRGIALPLNTPPTVRSSISRLCKRLASSSTGAAQTMATADTRRHQGSKNRAKGQRKATGYQRYAKNETFSELRTQGTGDRFVFNIWSTSFFDIGRRRPPFTIQPKTANTTCIFALNVA